MSLPSRKGYFTNGLAALAFRVSGPKVGGIDRRQGFSDGRAELPSIDQGGDFIEQDTLFRHVGRLEHGAGEHEFPHESGAFALKEIQVKRRFVFDDANNFALRTNHFGHDHPISICVIKIGDEIDILAPQRSKLLG
jgi:hypothetical protein